MTNSTKHESVREPTPDQQFWQLWRKGQRPDLAAFLAARQGLAASAVAAVIAIDQYERWMAGDHVPAEHYLALLPDDPQRDQAACDVVYGEYLLREQLGERPDPEDYLLQFPALKDPLSRQFDLHKALAEDAPAGTAPLSPAPTLHGRRLGGKIQPAPPLVAGYEVLEPIGKGGMGTVYKARQVSLHRVVALKIVHPPRGADSTLLDRMRREAQITARLSHPNIVTVFDAGLAGFSFYLAMEYVEGTDLHRLVEQHGPLPVATACDYVRQAALGLKHAAERGLVHRDIKPSNLIVSRPTDGGPGVLKILDLGLARLTATGRSATVHAPITQVGEFMGTPDFVAPEQAADPRLADARSDLYSLGCTLYYMLTGEAPFAGATPLAKLVQHHLQDAVPVEELRREVPPGVAALTRRLMAKRPEDRFQSADDLLHALPGVLAAAPAPRPARRTGLERRLTGHTDRVRGVAFSPDGRWLASASLDGDVRLWPLAGDGEPVVLDPYAGGVTCLAFTPDGRSLLCGTEDGSLQSWDVAHRAARWRVTGHPDAINVLAVSASGAAVVTAGHDGTLRLWDAGSGQLARSWMGHGGPVWGVGLTPDGRAALSGGQDRGLRLWDVARGESMALLPEQPMLVTCLAISPDGRLALTGGIDGVIHVWELPGAREVGTLEGHEGRVTEVAFSPDGARAASSSRDQTVRLWDVKTRSPGEVLREHSRWVTCVTWSPGGERIASGGIDRTVCLWAV